jgi:hypothetical protein
MLVKSVGLRQNHEKTNREGRKGRVRVASRREGKSLPEFLRKSYFSEEARNLFQRLTSVPFCFKSEGEIS